MCRLATGLTRSLHSKLLLFKSICALDHPRSTRRRGPESMRQNSRRTREELGRFRCTAAQKLSRNRLLGLGFLSGLDCRFMGSGSMKWRSVEDLNTHSARQRTPQPTQCLFTKTKSQKDWSRSPTFECKVLLTGLLNHFGGYHPGGGRTSPNTDFGTETRARRISSQADNLIDPKKWQDIEKLAHAMTS